MSSPTSTIDPTHTSETTTGQAPLAALPGGGGVGPDGRVFPWGPIEQVHQIGRYQIVEFLQDNSHTFGVDQDRLAREHGQRQFSLFIDGKSAHRSYLSLEAALVGGVAIINDGINTSADRYFFKMVGIE